MNHHNFEISIHDFSSPLPIKPSHFYFFIIIYGELNAEIDNQAYLFHDYDFFNLNPGMMFSSRSAKETVAYFISMEWDELCSYFDLTEETRIVSNQIPNTHSLDIVTSFVNLIESYKTGTKSNDLLIQSQFLRFIHELSCIPLISKSERFDTADKYIDRKKFIQHYIRTHFNQPITLRDLSSEMFLTPQYLSSFIKKEFGKTFMDLVHEVQLEKAKNSLLQSNTSITKIALSSGFPNAQSFNRTFRAQNDMSPIEYRRKFSIIPKPTAKAPSLEAIQKAEEELSILRNRISTNSVSYNYLFDLDVRSSIQSFERKEKTWLEMINLGFAESILSSVFQNQIATVQSELHFKYARIQGIFLSKVINIAPDSNKYTFTNINRIIDFLYSVNLIPFIDFGSKPNKFNIDSSHYQYISKDNQTPNLKDWENLIESFIVNAINRYGKDEVSKWIFEMWLPHDTRLNYHPREIVHYADQFAILHSIIKKNVPEAKIGGFGFNASADRSVIRKVESELSKRSVSFDFFSFVSFYFDMESDGQGTISSNQDFLSRVVDGITKSIYPSKTPIYLTEFSFGVASRNYIHDSVFHASFLLYNILNNFSALKGMGFWRLSDLSDEFTDTNSLLFGGNGLVSVDGLKKPVFHAYKLLTYLGNNIIASGPNYIITSKGSEYIQILVLNYEHPSTIALAQLSMKVKLNQISNLFQETSVMNYRFIIDDVLPGSYRFQTYLLNQNFGSVFDQWIKLGPDIRLDKNEIIYIQDICKPKQSIEYQQIDSQITVQGKVSTNEILLIRISQEY